ncbi:hypothetical protein AVEN_232143-1 [Araneus ventricosus]|uniref:Uncharacterized protein n=1 Tax=Araneus ventricosus TaxID=182803 RepID=A0A4Y2RM83_ARAVE|nr:hypothetical protein AVEN_232143-1 [Araneus ventricosus]
MDSGIMPVHGPRHYASPWIHALCQSMDPGIMPVHGLRHYASPWIQALCQSMNPDIMPVLPPYDYITAVVFTSSSSIV